VTHDSTPNLPEGWRSTTIGCVATVNPRKPAYNGRSDSDEVGFIPMAAIDADSGTVTDVDKRTLGDMRTKSYRTFASGDVLFAKITPCMENGKAALVPDLPGPGFGSTEFHVLRSRGNVEPEYLWRFVRQENYRKVAETHMTGSVGQLRVPADFLRDSVIPLPPLHEQQRIIQYLRAIDARRVSVAHRLAAAHASVVGLRSAVLAAACSGRLTANMRGSDAEESYAASGSRSHGTNPQLPNVPATYEITTVGAVSERLEYGTSRKANLEGEVPVLRMGNIQNGRIDTTDLKFLGRDGEVERLLLDDGDLLFNRTNSPGLVGKTAVFHGSGPITFASYLIRVKFHRDRVEPDYVAMWLNSAWGRAWARHVKTDGVSQSNINGKKLAAMPLPLPSIEEQREAVTRASAVLAAADGVEAAISEAGLALARATRDAVANAFGGRFARL
jgi:type I restriction enzyme S subunit